jgi:hypothetical protein
MNVMDKVDASENLRCRALIVHLMAGDQLTVGVPTGYQIHSNTYDVMFAGFLIQPDVASTNIRYPPVLSSTISKEKSACAFSTPAGIVVWCILCD